MRVYLALFVCLALSNVSFGQSPSESIFSRGVEGCYSDYYITFHNRGANDINDGEHEVVISVINQGASECYMGKVGVFEGKVTLPVYIKKDDGTYGNLAAMFKSIDQEWLADQDLTTLYEVHGGMTKMFLTQEKYQVRLFFPGTLNKNSVVNQKAPPVGDYLKK